MSWSSGVRLVKFVHKPQYLPVAGRDPWSRRTPPAELDKNDHAEPPIFATHAGRERGSRPAPGLGRDDKPAGIIVTTSRPGCIRSDAVAVAGDLGLRDRGRDHPGVERVALNIPSCGVVAAPADQRQDLDIELLAGSELDVSVLVRVRDKARGRDVIAAGRHVAVEDPAVRDRPEIAPVHVDVGEVQALRGFPCTVEPDARVVCRERWRRGRRRRGAARNRYAKPCQEPEPSA